MNATNRYAGEQILFITGRLAAPALQDMLEELRSEFDIQPVMQVMPITVAALMTPAWIARHLQMPEGCHRVVLPGYVDGDLDPIHQHCGVPVEIGPKDLKRLPEFFGGRRQTASLENYDIEIIAEINHAPRLELACLIEQAESLRADGADVIDIGCQPGETWKGVKTTVAELVDLGFRVSIDSLNPQEIQAAVTGGAELVLSVNSSNRRAAADWGCEVVAIPDNACDWLQLAETVEFLAQKNVPLRIDPILEPIGTGFAASLGRYLEARRIWPDAAMMMGIGNLTELTDVDSAGVNLILLAICQELNVSSVLTTQVINWARTSVKECDIARRLVFAAQQQGVPPKNFDSRLVCLRDPRLVEMGNEHAQQLASDIRDHNYRLFVENGEILLMGGGKLWRDRDPFELFHQLLQFKPANLDAAHAFYLGYEMCKAATALQLGKQYVQDEALSWGYLTQPESSRRRLKRNSRTSH